MTQATFGYHSAATGKPAKGVLTLEDYAEAERRNMRVSGLINAKYADADPQYGPAFAQGMRSLGIYVHGDPEYGILPSTVREVMTGECTQKAGPVQLANTTGSSPSGGGTIVSPGGPIGESTPASRVFFPEVVMAMMDEFLRDDYSREMAALQSMLASDETIASEVFTQPLINTTAPQGVKSVPIGQNALPRNMVSISTSQVSKAIATTAVGLQISEQAQGHATLDLVSIIVAERAEGERKAKLWSDIASIAAGNVDAGQAAMTPVNVDGWTGGAISQEGWMDLLWDPSRTLQIDSMMGTMADLRAIQKRTDRPLILDPRTTGFNTGNTGTYGANVEPTILNYEVYEPKFLLIPEGIFPAQHVLAFDSRYFLRRVRNSSASYSATEKMVMQRSDFFRWDSGELLYRLREEAGMLIDYS